MCCSFCLRCCVLISFGPLPFCPSSSGVGAGAGGVDGLVVANTTPRRPPSLRSPAALVGEKGGLSGAPLQDAATDLLRDLYR